MGDEAVIQVSDGVVTEQMADEVLLIDFGSDRFLSLNENQFLGCVSAFTDTLSGELNSALNYLRRLEGKRKGSAFAYEMQLDKHRYGALIVLERWGDFTRTFAGHVELGCGLRCTRRQVPRRQCRL